MAIKSLLTVAKPSGMSCFPYRKDPSQPCVLDEILATFPAQKQDWPTGFEGGIAHRLDIPTSGQLLIARDSSQLKEIRQAFATKKLIKRYVFLTGKSVSWTKHQVGNAIAHHPKNKRKMVVQRGQSTPHRGKWYPAQTHFRYLASEPKSETLHLWEAVMQTGVMHQIRLHAAFAGLALAGDRLYGGGATPSFFPSDFALHHCGIQNSAWLVEDVPVPDWWPRWVREHI